MCAACHSMEWIHYRDLVNVAYTEKEAKAIAAEAGTWDARLLAGAAWLRD